MNERRMEETRQKMIGTRTGCVRGGQDDTQQEFGAGEVDGKENEWKDTSGHKDG